MSLSFAAVSLSVLRLTLGISPGTFPAFLFVDKAPGRPSHFYDNNKSAIWFADSVQSIELFLYGIRLKMQLN